MLNRSFLFTLVAILFVFAGLVTPGFAEPAGNAKPAKSKLCVAKIHIIYGCQTCEAMLEWLKKGGVKIEMTDVQTGAYKLYPTVQYTDKATDHGELMYEHKAGIPEKLCVVRCNVVAD